MTPACAEDADEFPAYAPKTPPLYSSPPFYYLTPADSTPYAHSRYPPGRIGGGMPDSEHPYSRTGCVQSCMQVLDTELRTPLPCKGIARDTPENAVKHALQEAVAEACECSYSPVNFLEPNIGDATP